MSDSSSENIPRRLPIGAEILSDGAVHFRVWAPRSQRVEVIIGGGACTEAVIELNGERNGYFSARSPLARPGDLYRYRLDRSELCCARRYDSDWKRMAGGRSGDGVRECWETVSNSSTASLQRRLHIGAEVLADGGVHFRVWAPLCQKVEIIIDSRTVIKLDAEPNGYFSVHSSRAKSRRSLSLPPREQRKLSTGPRIPLSARRSAGPVHDHRSSAIPMA